MAVDVAVVWEWMEERVEPPPQANERRSSMLFDILIALLITVVAVVLGITVHPLLFLLIVLAVIWLVTRHSGGRRHVY
jgi:hypothetical protein